MVEIDAMVVNACREHIPQTAACLDQGRVDLRIEDGVKFVATTDQQFDVILVDSTDPIGPAQPLFGSDFYRDIERILAPDGIVVSQGETPWYQQKMQRKLCSILRDIFANNFIYNFSNMSYPGGLWSFTFASKKYCPVRDFDSTRVQTSGLEFEYYNPKIHRAAFSLPSFQHRYLADVIDNEG